MSVRQYIGARYIPLFIGAWDLSSEYEPLSVVTYQGNSYISRQYVPANIQISNEQYWFLWSNYNAQIEAYRQDVQTVQNSLDGIQTEIDAKADTSDLGSAAFRDVTNTVVAGNTDVPTSDAVHQAILNTVTFDNMVIIGDSYSSYSTNGLFTASWPEDLASALGLTLHKFAHPAIGWIRENDGHSFMTYLNEAIALTDKSTCKYVLVYGGINDFSINADLVELKNRVTNFCNTLATNFPNAQIYIAYINLFKSNMNDYGLAQYINAITEGIANANNKRIATINTNRFLYGTPNAYTTDNGHPSNEVGNELVFQNFMNVITGSGPLNQNIRIAKNPLQTENNTWISALCPDYVLINKGKILIPTKTITINDYDRTTFTKSLWAAAEYPIPQAVADAYYTITPAKFWPLNTQNTLNQNYNLFVTSTFANNKLTLNFALTANPSAPASLPATSEIPSGTQLRVPQMEIDFGLMQ